jgi:hypothetical protein
MPVPVRADSIVRMIASPMPRAIGARTGHFFDLASFVWLTF